MPDDRASLLRRAIAPITPGSNIAEGIALESVDAEKDASLAFRDGRGAAFVVRLFRTRPGGGCFATTGRLDVVLNLEGRSTPGIDRFVRALTGRLKQNTSSMTDAELDVLTNVTPPAIANPYMQRHNEIGVENIIDFGVSDACNLFCTFCTDENSRGLSLRRPTSSWLEALARAKEEGKKGLLISGNEPTLRNDLPEIIAEARRLGFVEIELSTAGVRLADRSYLAELIDAGLNVLAVSIHGSNAEIDGLQTGRREFFAPRQKGFENFRSLVGDRAAQERRGVFLKTITIFTQTNLADIPALVAFLLNEEVTYVLLHYAWIKGGALTRFDEVVPDYPSVVRAIEPLRAELASHAVRVAVANLPPCVAPDLPIGRTTTKSVVHPGAPATRGRSKVLSVVRDTSTMDPELVHAEPCLRCAARTACRGVSSRYLRRYGPAGLQTLASS